MLDRTILDTTRSMLSNLAEQLLKRNITANQVTIAGFLVGMTAVPLIIFDYTYLALVCMILNRLLDGVDGTLARLSTPTDRGGFLDIVLDFIFYSAIPVAFAIANPENNALAAAVLIYAFIGTGCSFLAFATIAEKRKLTSTEFPDKSFYYLGGLTEATETIVVFGVMCLFPTYFSLLAYGFAALCAITTVLRIRFGLEVFK
jgi:phosphatidylglycerophosphate synthase